MFCDLVDSTRLSGQLDPEELRNLVLRYQQLCVEAIEARGGYVSQYLGDGILAYFGYPTAVEHAVSNGVAAGLELQAAVKEHNRAARLAIEVRVGLHTGWAVVGQVGAGESREKLALGETPNVAARIQGLAPPGGVAVSQDTQRLAQTTFRWASLGVHQLKGVERAVEVFQPLELLAPAAAAPGRGLLGRERELATLCRAWSEGGGAVLVRGEAGLGKSRLTASFLETLDPEVPRSEFRCSPLFRSQPLAPVTDDLDEGSLAPEAREALFRRLAEPLSGVVVFEDLHWADPSTQAFVAHLLERPCEGRLILMTARPDFRPRWPVQVLELSPLAPTQIRRVIEGVAAGRTLSEETMAQLVRRSDGSPLFAEELTKAALEETSHVPDTLATSLMARLDRLGGARELAQMASLLGRDFSRDLLEALSPAASDGLAASLERLVEAEILQPVEGGFAFKHALLAEAAYESMLLAVRRELHERAAALLEARSHHPGLVAYHWARADQFEKAAQAYWEAGRRAALQSAEAEAVEHFRAALRCQSRLDPGPERDAGELKIQAALGPALRVIAGNSDPEVKATFERAEELWKLSPQEPELGMGILYGHFVVSFVSGRQEDARRVSRAMLDEATNNLDRVQAWTSRAESSWIGGRFAEALECAERACALYRPEMRAELVRRYGQDLGCHSFVDRALLLHYVGKPTPALRSAEQAVELARQAGHRFTLTYILLSAGRLYLDRREPEAAATVLSEAAELAGIGPDGGQAMHFPVITALLGLALARPEQVRQGIEERRRNFSHVMQTMLLCWLCELYRRLGRDDEARQALKEAQRENEPFYRPELLRLGGQPEQAHELALRMGSPMLALRAALDLGDPERLGQTCALFGPEEDSSELRSARGRFSAPLTEF